MTYALLTKLLLEMFGMKIRMKNEADFVFETEYEIPIPRKVKIARNSPAASLDQHAKELHSQAF